MRKFFIAVIVLCTAFIVSCSKQPSPEQVAGETARLYYDQLLHGQYDNYVDAFHRKDSIPESYRQQLIDNAKMFMALQCEEHRSVDSVRLVRAQADTAHHVANAFLMLCYGDSTREEIVVPMVLHNGTWMLK